jgi:hypothetical protein
MQIPLILTGILIAQLGDATTFVIGAALHGIAIESNPFALGAHARSGVEGVLLMKGAGIVVVLAVLVSTAERYPRLVTRAGGAAIGLGVLGVIANVTSLLILAG